MGGMRFEFSNSLLPGTSAPSRVPATADQYCSKLSSCPLTTSLEWVVRASNFRIACYPGTSAPSRVPATATRIFFLQRDIAPKKPHADQIFNTQYSKLTQTSTTFYRHSAIAKFRFPWGRLLCQVVVRVGSARIFSGSPMPETSNKSM